MDATDHDSRSGRNAPVRPPSGLNLQQIMDQQDRMHQSYNKRNDNFMTLESDESEITDTNLNFSPTDTVKMAAALKAEEAGNARGQSFLSLLMRKLSVWIKFYLLFLEAEIM